MRTAAVVAISAIAVINSEIVPILGIFWDFMVYTYLSLCLVS